MSEQPEEITDLDALKLMAHPLRHQIHQQLRRGPVNSTTLARELGMSTGLASYHLRQLAAHGFVEEVPELAKGRERWWRAVRKDRRFPPRSRQSAEMRALIDEMNRRDFATDLEDFARFQLQRDQLGEWGDAFVFSRGSMHIDHEDLPRFFEDYMELLYRYKNKPSSGSGRTVVTRFFAFPEASDGVGEE